MQSITFILFHFILIDIVCTQFKNGIVVKGPNKKHNSPALPITYSLFELQRKTLSMLYLFRCKYNSYQIIGLQCYFFSYIHYPSSATTEEINSLKFIAEKRCTGDQLLRSCKPENMLILPSHLIGRLSGFRFSVASKVALELLRHYSLLVQLLVLLLRSPLSFSFWSFT